ncbi:MAG: SulP family inorganic anion transporter, partial [Candidatus Binatia bacterium]
MRYLPFLDLRNYRLSLLGRDLLASCVVVFICVPQGVAYAIMAGLPPAAGLYAATFPAIVGSLFRSSRHVVTGPTNALSLLVGSGIALQVTNGGADAMQIGVTLALIVGTLQLLAGLLRLGVLVDYISMPVLRGYITGAGVLIAAGQLANVTATHGATGTLVHMLSAWVSDLSHTSPLAV